MHLKPLRSCAFPLAGALMLAAPVAAAEEPTGDKAACVAALDDAQSLQSAHELTRARAQLVACSSETCPDVVREDCAQSLRELDATIPTIVLSATVDGNDAVDAVVRLDGAVVEGALGGRALAVDPGPHVVRFERAGSAPVEVKVVAREGEKNRPVAATFVLPRIAPPPSPPRHVASEGGPRLPILSVVLGSAGLAAIGGGVFMRMRADSDAQDLRGSCAPACDPAERDALSQRLVVSNVALGIGAVALGASALTWLLARK